LLRLATHNRWRRRLSATATLSILVADASRKQQAEMLCLLYSSFQFPSASAPHPATLPLLPVTVLSKYGFPRGGGVGGRCAGHWTCAVRTLTVKCQIDCKMLLVLYVNVLSFVTCVGCGRGSGRDRQLVDICLPQFYFYAGKSGAAMC